MEVSNQELETCGTELIQQLVTLTGLPEPWVENELDQILEQTGRNSQSVTLDQLREALLVYLEGIQNDFLKQENARVE